MNHPLGCHRSRVPDRVVFEKLVEILVFGRAYRRIADEKCSATTFRSRRDEWMACEAMETLREIALEAYDRFIGLEHASASVGQLPEGTSVHLDRGYDSLVTRERLKERGLNAQIAKKGQPAPLQAGQRWVVERTNSWQAKLAHKKLVWCTERGGRVIDFWVAFSDVVIVVRRLIREGWSRYRWEGRPPRRP